MPTETKAPREIHYNSPDAAKLTKVEGWLSADGSFWPSTRTDAEHMARYCGSTHGDCKDCGAVIERRVVKCGACYEKARAAKYAAYERKPWDGSSWVTDFDGDQYFSELSELADYCALHSINPDELRLVHCKPNYASQICADDYFAGDLPEDGEVPEELKAAVDALNEVISKSEPLSYSPTAAAVELTQEQIETIKTWSIE